MQRYSKDERRSVLVSILYSSYSMCNDLGTSHKVKGPSGYKRCECNLAAVWGQMATSRGYNDHLWCAQGKIEIGELWEKEMDKNMLEAGKRTD